MTEQTATETKEKMNMPPEATEEQKSAKGPRDAEAAIGDSLYDDDFMQQIRDANEKLEAIENKRDELNAQSAAVIAKLKDDGIPKSAFTAARKYIKTKEEKRAGWDLAYQVCRKALGQPMQDDLFEASARQQVKQHQAGKKH
ncbi:MAG: hypothetical protein KDJ24_04540 [Gammaproteobacteria bacterium]|nr:hypothetical protein [Gammaproteobacteria bacterium]